MNRDVEHPTAFRRALARTSLATVLLWAVFVIPLAFDYSDVITQPTTQFPAVILALAVVLCARRIPTVALPAAGCLTLIATYETTTLWTLGVMIVGCYLVGRHSEVGAVAPITFIGVAVVGAVLSLIAWTVAPAITTLVIVAFTALPWWLGTYLRQRSELVEAGWSRVASLEREHELVADRARVRERAEIAREMHDALGHELSLLAVDAGALEVTELSEAQLARVVRIREAAVRGMSELHEIVGVLQDDSGNGITPVRSLDDLIEDARAAGTQIDFTLHGAPDAWPPTVGRAVYRIVQEILTNASKHAPGETLTLRIGADESAVRVWASNPLPAEDSAAPPGAGAGLAGMRERVRLLGGTLDAVRRAGEFVVAVSIPMVAADRPVAGSHDHTSLTDTDSIPSTTLSADRRRHRGRVAQAAIVPIGLLILVVGALFAVNAVTASRVGLDGPAFRALDVGSPESQVEDMLPVAYIDEVPAAFHGPAQPKGATCRFYRSSTSPFVLSPTSYYRLCFDDGELVSKDVFT